MKSANKIIQVPINVEKNSARKAKAIKLNYKDMKLEIHISTESANIMEILRAVKSC